MSGTAKTTTEPAIIDLGRICYADALRRQLEAHAAVLAGRDPPTVFLLEHDPPVITITPRAAEAGHLLASPAQLESDGIELARTDRGGLITYHGPGQLVVYPILPLSALGLNVRCYVHALEGIVIDTLAAFGIDGRRDAAGIGVWVGSAKIAAVGVRVRRWVTLHGLALNVAPNLDHYRHIVACGLDAPVTSMQRLLGGACPSVEAVKAAAIAAIREHLGGCGLQTAT